MRTLALMAAALAMSVSAPAYAKSSGRQAQDKGEAQLPICSHKLGTVSIVEPDNDWWHGLGLSSPEAVIKMFVMRSGCFGLVDRNKGLMGRNIERALADNGELQEGSNIGRGQVKAADYLIVPDLVNQNEHSGGNAVGAAVGGWLGNSTIGALAGGLTTNKKEANVMLTLVNARTTEMERMTEGYYRKTDIGWNGGGGVGWWGGFGALGASGYSDTQIGQIIVLAYLDAYKQLVAQLGGLPADPSAAAPAAQ